VGQAFLGGPLGDRGRRGAELVERLGVDGQPLPVRALYPVEECVVDVQVRIVLAGVVLEERRDGPLVGIGPAARGAAVVPGPGVAGPILQVREAGVVARPDRVLDCGPERLPRLRGLLVPLRAGGDLLGLERGVDQRHRLLNVERDVVERHVVPGGLARLCTEFSAAFSTGTGLLFKRSGVQVVLGQVLAPGVPEGGHLVPPVGVLEPFRAGVEESFVDRPHVLGVDQAREPELLRAGAPPAPRRLTLGDRAGVVALPAGRDLLQQVLRAVTRVDLHDHHAHPPIETILRAVSGRSTARSVGSGRPEAGRNPRIVMPRCESFDLVSGLARSWSSLLLME